MTEAAFELPRRAAGVRAARWHRFARRAVQVVRAIVGAPDYEAYLAHMRAHHPNEEPLGPGAFARERLEARYSRPGSRCC